MWAAAWGLVFTIALTAMAAAQQGAPTLSELETLRYENLKLKVALAQTQALSDACKAELGMLYQALGKVRADRATADLTAAERELKAEIDAAHPGFEWNPKTGALTKKGGD